MTRLSVHKVLYTKPIIQAATMMHEGRGSLRENASQASTILVIKDDAISNSIIFL